jgi:hypothetical protein
MPETPIYEPTLTASDAAARLSLSVHSVLALIASGKLVASDVSLGTKRPRWRIEAAEISRFLADRQSVPGRVTSRRRRSRGPLIEYV